MTTQARTITTPATVTLEVILASDPDTAVASWEYLMQTITIDFEKISGKLVFEDVLNQKLDKIRVTPTLFPGVFTR